MIYYFDTSSLNDLLNDLECNAIATTLTSAASVRISALNILEAVKTSDAQRRYHLIKLMAQLSDGKRPLDMPDTILLSYAKAHAVGATRAIVNSDRDLDGIWNILNQPEILDDESITAAKDWARQQELAFASVVASDREVIQSILSRGDKGRNISAATTLRAYLQAKLECQQLVSDIYSKGTNKLLTSNGYKVLMREDVWPLYFLSYAYGIHTRGIRINRFSSSGNAGAIDLTQSVYLTLCDRFVTSDRAQYRALRQLNVLNTKRRAQVLQYRTFRKRLLAFPR